MRYHPGCYVKLVIVHSLRIFLVLKTSQEVELLGKFIVAHSVFLILFRYTIRWFILNYSTDVRTLNMQGKLAVAFGDLLKKLWAPPPGQVSVNPRHFKAKLGRFAPQFSDLHQHDSQVGCVA